MAIDDFSPPSDEEKLNVTALALSALVHVLLVGALFFGVQWKSQPPSSVSVEVWRSAPGPVAAVKSQPEPPAPPRTEPAPQPETRPEPRPVPKAAPTPPAKPDITVKEEKKKDEPKKPEPKPEPKKDEPRKEEPKKPETRKEEPKKPEPKAEPRDFARDLERELKETQQKKVATLAAQSRQADIDAELARLGQMKGAQAATARKAGEDKYRAALTGKIRGNIVLPPGIKGNPEAEFRITQLPSGEVIGVHVTKSSGNRALDDAIERAINKSSPLPLPDDPSLFHRELILKYRPFEE